MAVTFRGRAFRPVWQGRDGAPILTEVEISDIDGNHVPDIIYGREDDIVEAILR